MNLKFPWLLITLAVLSQNTPDHCYQFTSNSVTDSCGGASLTRHEGNHLTPDCGSHGCSFSFNSFFYALVPNGLSTTYTIGLWVRDQISTSSYTFSIVSVRVRLSQSQSDTTADLQLYQKTSSLRRDSSSGSYSLTIDSQWDSTQWAYIYLFSDAANSRNGFGAYVPTVGSNIFQQSLNGVEDLSSYSGSSGMRIGTKASGYFPASFIRYMVIYKSQAIHAGTMNALQALLGTIKCPNLVATTTPACSTTYAHYILTSQYSLNTAQQLVDTSGKLRHATNGLTTSSDSKDCAIQPDGVLFNGNCQITFTNLNISNRGFSFDLFILLSSPLTSTTTDIIRETATNNFVVSLQPSTKTITISIVTTTLSVVCNSLSTTNWVKVAFSFVSNASTTQVSVFCAFQMVIESPISQNINFALNTFAICRGFQGKMRDLAIYQNSLGRESFSIPTSSKLSLILVPLCDPSFYFDLSLIACTNCPDLCTVCQSSTVCSTCETNASLVNGLCTCDAGFYKSGSSCVACNSLCATCSAQGSTNCFTCAAGALSISGTSECVQTCPPNYFQINSSCNNCALNCEQCTGSTPPQCTLCQTSYFYNPITSNCELTCSSSYFPSIPDRKCHQCSTTCSECNGSSSTDCTSCIAGLTLKPDNSCSCPASQFLDQPSGQCLVCSQSCLTCAGSASTCTSCSLGHTLEGGLCFCPNSLPYNGLSCDCFSISPDGQCSNCGNALLDPGEECDDANLQDNDGCSSSCFRELDFICSSSSLPTQCSFLRKLSIAMVTFTPSPSEITVTIALSAPVFVQSLTIADLSISTSLSAQPALSFSPIISSRISVLSFTLDPHASIPSNTTFEVSIDSSQMQSLDSSVVVPSTLSESGTLPSQDYLDPAVSTLASTFEYIFQSFAMASLFGGLLTQICLDISLEPLWVLFNTNQLLYFIPLISISFPSNAIALFKILSFAHGDLIIVVMLYNLSFGRLFPSQETQESPFTPNFLILGYETNSLLENCGIFFFLLSIQGLLLLLFYLGSKICYHSCARKCFRCSRGMLCAPFIRTFLEAFLELSLCCCLALYQTITGFHSLSDILSTVLGFASLVAALLLASKFMNVTAHSPYELSDTRSRVASVYSETYSRLQIHRGFLALNFFSWFLFRRLMVVMIIILLTRFPLTQIILHILLAVADVFILSVSKPFTSKFDFFFNLFNSAALLLFYILVLVLHLSGQTAAWQIMGWVLLSTIVALNCFNIILLFSFKLCEMKTKRKQLKEKQKKEKEARYKLEKFIAKHPQSSGAQVFFTKKQSPFSNVKDDPRFCCKAIRKENWGSQCALNLKALNKEEEVVQEIY